MHVEVNATKKPPNLTMWKIRLTAFWRVFFRAAMALLPSAENRQNSHFGCSGRGFLAGFGGRKLASQQLKHVSHLSNILHRH